MLSILEDKYEHESFVFKEHCNVVENIGLYQYLQGEHNMQGIAGAQKQWKGCLNSSHVCEEDQGEAGGIVDIDRLLQNG